MGYITYQELITRFPLIKTKYADSATDVTSDLIAYAEADLNGRLGSVYATPFNPVPPIVKDLTMNLAYCNFLGTSNPKKAKIVCKLVNERIEAIVEGRVSIATGSGTVLDPANDTGEMWSNVGSYHPTFSMLDAESPYSRVDSGRIWDEEEERV